MTEHPITPPPELVQEWGHDANLSGVPYDDETGHWEYEQYIAARAAQWGADTELEACVNWLDDTDCEDPQEVAQRLRAARRPKPKPLSLKEQALEMLENAWEGGHVNNNAAQTIRRALEALDD